MPPNPLRRAMCWVSLLVLSSVCVCRASAGNQAAKLAQTSPARVHVVLLSDVHFDPFQDPQKVARLDAEPVERWSAILRSKPSADQAKAFAHVRDVCGKNVFDASPALLSSTVKGVRAHRGSLAFGVMTGDLLVHDFGCRYGVTLPGQPSAHADAFLLKTLKYVIEQMQFAMAGKPLYVALGNNDTLCGDYKLDADGKLFRGLGKVVAQAAHIATSNSFSSHGGFAAELPAPLRHTRVLVLDNLPFSKRFANCSGTPSAAIAADDRQWLKAQLQAARRGGEKVWFVAHIPPGVDPRRTLYADKDVCATRAPVMLLGSNDLPEMLVAYADILPLTLFGHTHMDEFRVLTSRTSPSAAVAAAVAVKIIPSISPVAGNTPSFTIAIIDAGTATMLDYTVYGFAPRDGADLWVAQYSFREASGLASFTGNALQSFANGLQQDTTASQPASANYIRNYSPGTGLYGLGPVWPRYACVLTNTTEAGFLNCACPAGQVQP